MTTDVHTPAAPPAAMPLPAVTLYPTDETTAAEIIVVGDNPTGDRPRATLRVIDVGPARAPEAPRLYAVDTWTPGGFRHVYDALPAATPLDAALTAYRVTTAARPYDRGHTGPPRVLAVHTDGTVTAGTDA